MRGGGDIGYTFVSNSENFIPNARASKPNVPWHWFHLPASILDNHLSTRRLQVPGRGGEEDVRGL
jgi:hypothetical protein